MYLEQRILLTLVYIYLLHFHLLSWLFVIVGMLNVDETLFNFYINIIIFPEDDPGKRVETSDIIIHHQHGTMPQNTQIINSIL